MVFATLAFSGGSLFRKVTVPFDTLVIDEAAQALEPSCLVPLAVSIKQVPVLFIFHTVLMVSTNIWASATPHSVIAFARDRCSLLSSTLGVIRVFSGFDHPRLGSMGEHGK